eukprot:CAMPEP_0201574314 /NCGR_PEP_ID=MMETSP0190_2-20130828/18745_1 /ASSEMBLY_ACC=CAM_ASM_000263 /TAXON_ID=37353 /ORGANISM="Rosalina sp." /LENGTH=606 /DNA_ID=CAMNT_0048002403 /DNA_START=108 /DNA_END=1928 /DNA_ORIENTATION=+
MAFDLTSIDPSEFIEFRDQWIKDSNLDSVGADRLFENCGLSELVELDGDELKEYGQEIGLSVIERKRLIKGVNRLNGVETPKTPRTPMTPSISKDTSNNSIPSKPVKNDSLSPVASPRTPKGKKSQPTLSISTSTSSKKKSKSKSKGKGKGKRGRSKSSAPTPTEAKSRESRGKSPRPSKKDKSKRKKVARQRSTSSATTPIMYDPTGKTPDSSSDKEVEYVPPPKKDMKTQIEEAMNKLNNDANLTKNEIRKTFMEFKQKITEREMRLLHDVDTTVDKKTRLLQTQLEYVKDNGAATELAVDPSMKLLIEKPEILRTLITAGWVQGASSDNKEEQEMQDRERRRRQLTIQQYITVEKLKKVTIHERECKTKREDSMRLSGEIEVEITNINVRTAKCEAELAKAKPLLEEAKKLVSTISKKQLDEIRVLKKPPAVVELVMSAVAVILGNKIKSWRDIQKVLSNSKFVPSIMNFDTMTLKKKTREEVVKYVKHEDFNEERANKASKVAGPLVKWVISQVKYSELLDIVRPMQKEIKVLKKKLDKKQKQLKMCYDVINELELKISGARTEISDMVNNMIEMQDKYGLDEEYKSMGYDTANELYKTISL